MHHQGGSLQVACRMRIRCGKADDELFPTDSAAAFGENDRRAIESPTGVQSVEVLTYSDGSVHHSLVSKFPIPDEAGFDDFLTKPADPATIIAAGKG